MMDPPRRVPASQRTQTRPSRSTEAALSTAPASPQEKPLDMIPSTLPRKAATHSVSSSTVAPPYSTLGHLSFTPATQQTVVTTTTTTTVSLPPLLIRPPRDITARDPKQYPLAFSPTPHSIKRFCIDVGGRPVVYRESDDVDTSLDKYQRQRSILQAHDGIYRQERNFSRTSDGVTQLGKEKESASRPAYKRPASPPSLAEAAELASLQRRRKKPRSLLARTISGRGNTGFADASSAEQDAPFSTSISPITPDTDTGNLHPLTFAAADDLSHERRRQSGLRAQRSSQRPYERQERRLGSLAESAGRGGLRLGLPYPEDDYDNNGVGAAATPPVADDDLEPLHRPFAHLEGYTGPLPATLLNSSQQDASLPSPSLSPVTAAANLARSHQLMASARDAVDDENVSVVSGLDLDEAQQQTNTLPKLDTRDATLSNNDSRQAMSIMDVPTVIDYFDSIPDEMQSYVLYQLLRRSKKKTLQLVASIVNPALKCDPFHVLPVELGLQITRFLDAQSRCRAAQVSKRWRQLLDSDERAWKELLERDGFTLPDGEIERAVREGWAWQNPGLDGFEEDLSVTRSHNPRSRFDLDPLDASLVHSISSDDAGSSASVRLTRHKRKAASSSSSHKRQKRKASKRVEDRPSWIGELEQAQGPISFASAAAKAVPNPNVGLPSLSNLHLFKSIYQRHYLMSKSWMDQNSHPHHLAFRAHDRHVVTCLLFDSDKVLTGSDDTNINVYDTKTGVLRRRLEGHDGGVWALQYEGDTLVSGSTDRSVRIWDIPSGRCMHTFQGHTSTVRCLVILKPVKIGTNDDGSPIMMPKEPLIITGSRDSTLRVWKLPNPGDPEIHQAGPSVNDSDNPYALQTLSGHHNSVRAIAAHGDTLVSGSYDCTVKVWKISTGEAVHHLRGHSQKVYSVVLDHERQRCISGSMDNLVKVWSIESGVCLFNLEGHTSLVGLLDLSHERLVSAAADSTLRIWHPENGQCMSTLSAHTGAITCFQHDHQKVISGSDRNLKMWNIETGECVRDLLLGLNGVWQVRFDERRCIAAVQRNSYTYIEILDFGAGRDGVSEADRGRRILVNSDGDEIDDVESLPDVQPAPAA